MTAKPRNLTTNLEEALRPIIAEIESLANKVDMLSNSHLSIGETITCPECAGEFAIHTEFMGIITCCYCGTYIEG